MFNLFDFLTTPTNLQEMFPMFHNFLRPMLPLGEDDVGVNFDDFPCFCSYIVDLS